MSSSTYNNTFFLFEDVVGAGIIEKQIIFTAKSFILNDEGKPTEFTNPIIPKDTEFLKSIVILQLNPQKLYVRKRQENENDFT